jgi:KUP system potassium uptake protein
MKDVSRRPTGRRAALAPALGTLGVVFGDIGTSPIYALHVAFTAPAHAVPATQDGVYGIVSLVFWTITLVVSVKYVTLIMRAGNGGEGGIMALIALVRRTAPRARSTAVVVTLGLFGAAMFYGDGMITPAISVLSAVEGLDVAAPAISPLIVPISVGVLVGLFAVQRYGTGAVGVAFGPVMLTWFAVLAVTGGHKVLDHPQILEALSPSYGLALLFDHTGSALFILGAVVLTVTGAEALYADMGHFGLGRIRRAWFVVVFPALILNYLGQGALVLEDPDAIDNPFFLLVPSWGQMAMVVLATAATVIASQAVIAGAFSLTHQAVQLGLLPAVTVRHTSDRVPGQVYAPAINWALCAAVVALVVGFGSSARLASAYGIAVTATMVTTTVLFFHVARVAWRKPLWLVIPGATAVLAVDGLLFAGSLTKLGHGGWLPVTVGLVVFTLLSTWATGRRIVVSRVIREEGPLRRFVEALRAATPPVHRAPGTAVFVAGDRETTPLALRNNLEHNNVVHENVVIVFLKVTDVPHVAVSDRLEVDALGYRDDGITLVTARFGYRDTPSLARTVSQVARDGAEGTIDALRASYYLSRITVVPGSRRTMRTWRKHLFIAMWNNRPEPDRRLGAPDGRTVMMGSVVEI